jgi:hypothetical protein
VLLNGENTGNGSTFPVLVTSDTDLACVTGLSLVASTTRRTDIVICVDLSALAPSEFIGLLVIVSAQLADVTTSTPIYPRVYDEWWPLLRNENCRLRIEVPLSASYWAVPSAIALDMRLTSHGLNKPSGPLLPGKTIGLSEPS